VVSSVDAGGSEEDMAWSEDKIWAEWIVDLDSLSEENTLPTEENEFCADDLDLLQASIYEQPGADSSRSESMLDEGHAAFDFVEGDESWMTGGR